MTTHRDFIISLGGYRKVAQRLGKPGSHRARLDHPPRTASFPSHLYRAFCELADEAGVARPEPDLFRFLPLPPEPEERAAA